MVSGVADILRVQILVRVSDIERVIGINWLIIWYDKQAEQYNDELQIIG